MFIQRLAVVLFASLLYVPTALAAPIELPSRVESVTVFPSGVSIRRTGTLHTDGDVQQLVFGPLPVELSDATIRIGGFGPDVTAERLGARPQRAGCSRHAWPAGRNTPRRCVVERVSPVVSSRTDRQSPRTSRR